jgi:hypothetical protein
MYYGQRTDLISSRTQSENGTHSTIMFNSKRLTI